MSPSRVGGKPEFPSWRQTNKGLAMNPKKKPEAVASLPKLPPPGFTYAIDGATGLPVPSTYPKCGKSCRSCWPGVD